MLNQALAKINDEINQNSKDPYIQTVGRFLLQHIKANPEAADKILTTDKTIAKSLDVMRQEAQKKQVNRCGMFTPEEGFNIVLKYFEIKSEIPASATADMEQSIQKPANEKKASTDFDIKLEDLI
ncbi:MAG: hypothetical protein K0R80_2882 [Clostridia bacterium]|jgi:hypothetical protein|nr:hypothetical protein [Clostridia bacterium]